MAAGAVVRIDRRRMVQALVNLLVNATKYAPESSSITAGVMFRDRGGIAFFVSDDGPGMTTDEVAIWFGILVLIVVEVGLITPPVGMNLFIINNMDKDTPMTATYKSVLFFVGSDILRVVILLMFPIITLVFI